MRAVVMWLVVLMCAASTPAWAARTLAVLPLGKGAGEASYDGLGTALAGMLVSDLSTVEGLQLVERERLADVLAELKLGQSGFLDPKTAQKLGKGVGSELILTGSFSVIGDQFLMDTRLVEVKTGAILKATQGKGAAADFVAVEKDVVEQLLDGLAVQLSLAQRRKLLLEAPTEDLEALSQYGLGVQAQDGGDEGAAQRAFEAALREDPDFTQASLALADLKRKISAASETAATRYTTERDRARGAVLDAIPSELSRDARFEDTPESDIDFSIRLYLLRLTDQKCQAFTELSHYFTRRKGKWKWWVDRLPGADHRARWANAKTLMGTRVAHLHKVSGAPEKTLDPWDLMHSTGLTLSSGSQVLVSRNLQPNKFGGCLAGLLEVCFEPADREAQWTELATAARKFKIVDASLSSTVGEGPSPITLDDALRVHQAYLRAEGRGVDQRVQQAVDGLLARHPAGSPKHRTIVSAGERIVRAGEAHDRRKAVRHGMTREALEGAAIAVRDQNPSALRLSDAMCAGITTIASRSATRALERLAEPDGDRFVEGRVDGLGEAIAPVVLARCFVASPADPLTLPQVFALTRAALERPHPAANVERCTELWEELKTDSNAEHEAKALNNPPLVQPSAAVSLLNAVHSGRARLCLADG